jgi:hypothetical protein
VPIDVVHRIGAECRAAAGGRRFLDVLLARLATRQAGTVGRAQLAALGFTRREIELLVRDRRLIRMHRGVYAVGHEALSDRGRIIAALLAVGPGAVVSHTAAAYVWKLIPSLPPFVHVTLIDRVPRRRRGIRIHQANRLDTTIHQQLPITTPAQTLAQLPARDAARARAEALVLGLVARSADDHAEPLAASSRTRCSPRWTPRGSRARA